MMKKGKEIKRGHFYTFNNRSMQGHKARVVSVKKGKVKAVQVTHSSRVKTVSGRKLQKTIPLQQNPDSRDSRKAFVIRKPKTANIKNVGKHHPEMKVTNKQDKSLFRKIGRKNKQKNRWD